MKTILEADEELSMPVVFKLFEPCTRDMHELCSVKTETHVCICWCHLTEEDKKDEEDSQDENQEAKDMEAW